MIKSSFRTQFANRHYNEVKVVSDVNELQGHEGEFYLEKNGNLELMTMDNDGKVESLEVSEIEEEITDVQ